LAFYFHIIHNFEPGPYPDSKITMKEKFRKHVSSLSSDRVNTHFVPAGKLFKISWQIKPIQQAPSYFP